MRKSQSGFTLIELIVVIVILATLAAFALPRFANLQAQARIAKMNGALGAMKAAQSLSHALALANGLAADYSGAGAITVEGVSVTLVFGYPNAQYIAPLAGIGGTAAVTAAGTLGDYYVVGAPTATTITLAPDANHIAAPYNCTFTYTAPTAAGLQPVFVTTNLTTANCD